MTTQIIILAAGQGKRMGGDLPKVLVPLDGKPLIGHLLERVRASGVCRTPTIVVGHRADLVEKTLGPRYNYVTQTERRGTGHAVAECARSLKGKGARVMVFYGDMPFVSAEVIRNLENAHRAGNAAMTLATVQTPDFEDWRSPFYFFGRVLRNKKNEVIGSVEYSDCTEEQKKIKDLNPGYFCFDAEWLWKSIKKIKNNNAQKEYYIGDLIPVALAEGRKIGTIDAPPETAVAVNTPEHLRLAESALQKTA